MKHLMVVPALLLGMSFSSHAQTIMAGSEIAVRATGPITVSEWDRGRMFPGYVVHDVIDGNGNVVIPRGTAANFVVRQTGYDQLSLDVDSVILNGNRYPVDATGPVFTIPHGQYDSGAALSAVMSSISAAPGSTVYVEVVGDELRVPNGAVVRSHFAQPTQLVMSNPPTYYSYPQQDTGAYR